MRKIIITACLLTALFQVQTYAQFSVAVNTGMAGMLYNINDGKSKIKPNVGLDLGFTHTFSKHWGFVTGIGVTQYSTDAFMNSSSEVSENQVDDMGAAFRYTVKSTGYKESQRFIGVNIPLMIQYRTAKPEKTQWFFNAGAKFILPFDAKIKAEAQQLDLSGYYPDVNLEIKNLPQRGFGTVYNWSSETKYVLKPEIAISGLTGISFNLKNGYRLSLGVYCDYGMSGMKKITDLPLVTYNAPLTSGVTANSVLAINNTGFVRAFAAGIQFKLDIGKKKVKLVKPEIVDGDKDGVPDSLDLCPCVAGCAAFRGCPDTDGDGIPDNLDKCPDVKGLAKYQGCPIPDRDKDGINDEEDKCPDVPGVARYQGCPVPDRDKDGINDDEDKCPDVPGLARYQGCPIPDTDKDGINDEEDKCPTIPGVKENNGCPVIQNEVIKKTNKAAENILFETSTDKLKSSSFKGLNDIIKIMQETPGLYLYIDGHTDSTGSDSLNQTLSENRAKAVQQYLTNKGIDNSRIHVAGYGKTRPVADNKTAAGRRQNRRVELRLSYN